MGDPRYGSALWKRTRKLVLRRDGYACRIQGPKCRGHATTVHHIHPASKGGPFYDEANLVAACVPCNQGGGRKIAAENQRGLMLQLAGAIEQLSQRIYAVSERVAVLERANPDNTNGKPELPAGFEPHIY